MHHQSYRLTGSGTRGGAPVVNQIEWTPFGWDAEMLDYCRERGIVIQGYSPLTRGERLDDLNERYSALGRLLEYA